MRATRFRTRPVEIEAFRYLPDAVEELIEWSENNFRLSNVRDDGANALEFTGMIYDKLHVAWIPVKTGQWIVRGAKNEFYPCDDETFHWKYEELKNVGCGEVHPQADVYHREGHWVVK